MFAERDNGYFMSPSNVDSQGAFLIDRSPTYFEPILNYLRNGQLIFDNNVNPEGSVWVNFNRLMLVFLNCSISSLMIE